MSALKKKLRRLEDSPGTALAALAASAAVCASQINVRSTWGDEICSVYAVTLPGLSETWKYLVNDIHPPFYFLLLKGWLTVFGSSLIAARALSVVFIVAGLFLVWLTGRRFFSARAGLWAVLFAGFTPFLIYHSVHARMYSLLFMLAALAVYAGLLVREEPRPGRWLLLIAAGVGLLYTQYVGVFLLAGIFAGAAALSLRDRRGLRSWLLAGTAVAVLFGPWVPVFLRQTSTSRLGEGAARFTFGLHHLKYFAKIASPFDHSSWLGLGFAGAVAAGLLVAAGAWLATRGDRRDSGRWVVVTTAVGIGLFIAAATVKPIVVTRTMIWFLPAFALLSGVALARLPGPARMAAGALLLVGISVSFPDLNTYRRHTDWRGAVAWLADNYRDGDAVVLDRSVTFCENVVLQYYIDRSPLAGRLILGQTLLRSESGSLIPVLPLDPNRRWFFVEPSEKPSVGLHQALLDVGFVMQDRVTRFEVGLTRYDPPERALHRPPPARGSAP